jgi:hypothetical protein
VPKEMELALEKQARKKGLSGERKDAYVYGTMRKAGWKPGQNPVQSPCLHNVGEAAKETFYKKRGK